MQRLLSDRQLREKLGQRNVTPEEEADAAITRLIGIG